MNMSICELMAVIDAIFSLIVFDYSVRIPSIY